MLSSFLKYSSSRRWFSFLFALSIFSLLISNCGGGDGCSSKKLSYKVHKNKKAARIGFTQKGIELIAENLEVLIKGALKTEENSDGYIEVPISPPANVTQSIPGGLGNFNMSLHQNILLLKWKDLDINVQKSCKDAKCDGAQVIVLIKEGRLGFKPGEKLAGSVNIDFCKRLGLGSCATTSDVACPLKNGVDSNTTAIADMGIIMDLTIDNSIDSSTGEPKGILNIAIAPNETKIKQIKTKIDNDTNSMCSAQECQDIANDFEKLVDSTFKYPSGCSECAIVCSISEFGTWLSNAIVKGLTPAINRIIEPALKSVFEEMLKDINGQPLIIQDEQNISSLAGNNLPLKFTGNPLAYSIAAEDIDVNCDIKKDAECFADSTIKTLEVTFNGGSDSRPMHRCTPKPKDFDPQKSAEYFEQIFPAGSPPQLDGKDSKGNPYHLSATISQSFLQRALFAMYLGGNLCIDFSSQDMGSSLPIQLNGQTLFGLPGLSELGKVVSKDSPLIFSMSPSQKPELIFSDLVKKGADGNEIKVPMMNLKMKDMAIAVYAYLEERYARIFQITTDITLDASFHLLPNHSLEINIDKVMVDNYQDVYQELVDDVKIGKSLKMIVDMALGLLLKGTVKIPLDVTNMLSTYAGIPLNIEINEFVRRGQKQDFLSLLLSLKKCPGGNCLPMIMAADTTAYLDHAYPLYNYDGQGNPQPRGAVRIFAGLEQDKEVQYRVDNTYWSTFKPAGMVEIKSDLLKLKGQHRIEVRARYIEQYKTLDPHPAVVEVEIEY